MRSDTHRENIELLADLDKIRPRHDDARQRADGVKEAESDLPSGTVVLGFLDGCSDGRDERSVRDRIGDVDGEEG